MELLHNPIFLFLLIVIVGDLVGRVRLKVFSFGSSAVIFVAIAFGHFGYVLPNEFQTLGLVLFIYSVGLQAGPGFMASFKKQGVKFTVGALSMVVMGLISAVACGWGFGFGPGTTSGLLAGALTSTPGLAVAVEMTGNTGAPAAYGLTYTIGVVSVILFLRLLPKLLRVNLAQEEQKLGAEMAASHPPVTFRHFEITNPNLFNQRVADIALGSVAKVIISRLLRKGADEPILVSGDTVLQEGDRIRVVGREEDLKKVDLFVGDPIEEDLQFNRALSARSIVVSKAFAAGQTILSLNLRGAFNVQVSRITRNGIDLTVDPHARIHIGDTLHVVGDERALSNMARLLGNDVKATYAANVVSIFVGLLAGFLIGKSPLYFPWVGIFTLGTSGGVLVAGLLLSRVYKTGPFIWDIPTTTNSFIRDLGLMLFLATVGCAAGATIVPTIHANGLPLLLSGIVVAVVPLITSVIVCRFALKLPFLRMLGVVAGGMTSTPGLATATSMSETSFASQAYATVYPVALIGMILVTKLVPVLIGPR